MSSSAKILFIGDIVGKPGRNAVRALLPRLREKYSPDVVIANCENAAGGFGITPEIFEELKSLKIDVFTSGNHIWDKKEIIPYLESGGGKGALLRPANYPQEAPGEGSTVFKSRTGISIGVVNLSGTVFMESYNCPLRTGLNEVNRLKSITPVVVVDMHGEATSEKAAVGYHLDGAASAVIGTHTHVQTSDERILPKGTAFITDAGMTGPVDSIIGMDKDIIITNLFLKKMPARFEVASGPAELQGVFVEANLSDGRAISIERIKIPV